jgi:hypothetical protein
MFSRKQKAFKIIIFSSLFLLAVPFFVHARGLVPCGGYNENPCTVTDIFYLLARVSNWLIMIAGVFAVQRIGLAGFWLVVSAGNEETISTNKKALSHAVVGLVFALLAFLFVNTGVNFLLRSRCKLDLRNPLTYLSVCNKNPVNIDLGK